MTITFVFIYAYRQSYIIQDFGSVPGRREMEHASAPGIPRLHGGQGGGPAPRPQHPPQGPRPAQHLRGKT